MYVITMTDIKGTELELMLEGYNYEFVKIHEDSEDFPVLIEIGPDGEIDRA